MASGQAPRSQAEHMTAPSSLVQPEKDLAARAVPHMSQSPYSMPKHKVAHGQPTVMAMLECYEPSLVAWRILSRAADAFMIVDDEDAVGVMNRLANPRDGDPAVVAAESVGLVWQGC